MRIAFFALLLICAALIASDADASYRLSEKRAEKQAWIKASVAEVMWDLNHNSAEESRSKIDCSKALSAIKRDCRIRVRNEGSVVCKIRLTITASWNGKHHRLKTKISRNTCY